MQIIEIFFERSLNKFLIPDFPKFLVPKSNLFISKRCISST